MRNWGFGLNVSGLEKMDARMTQTPEGLLKSWMAAINEGDIEGLLALYNEKGVVFPTFSNRLLTNPERIRNYFTNLGSRDELSLALHEKTLITQHVENEIYSLSGIYCWRFAVDGELFSFEARFSFVADLSLEAPILHHH